MSTSRDKLLLLLVDLITINSAWLIYYLIRIESEWIAKIVEPELVVPIIVFYCYWLVLFIFVGLYRPWYAQSRFDEFALIFKTVTFGVIVLFFVIFIDDASTNAPAISRMVILLYWGIMILFIGGGRLAIRSLQRRLLRAGIGLRRSLIIGWSQKAKNLFDMIERYPALGYTIVGFVRTDKRKQILTYKQARIVGVLQNLPALIKKFHAQELLVALESTEHEKLLEVIRYSDSQHVGIKIMPDMYDIISGQARTNQIYGFPLIEIMPEIMPPWEQSLKRLIDIGFSFCVLVIGFPFWLLVGLCIKLSSPGPMLYRQKRVGKDGQEFIIYKFRSMHGDAEKYGPQWAGKKDPRVTTFGWFLRKSHLDEIPQFINVFQGDMSLVGPRPERPFFVEKLSKDIPLYQRRLKVRPGITGWAQVKHKYDESVEDVKVKLQYDLFYIENMSIRMDLKIILNTIYVMLAGKGHA
jgi:exopolysaccharide biosynthesis polyprenyl glycosylphosphotransferase